MAGTTFKTFDKQRFRKTYPSVRKRPITALISDSNFTLESTNLTFTEASGTTSATYNFNNTYINTPTVTYGVQSLDGEMVVVRISSISNTSVTIELSAPFDGSIDLQILEIL